MYLSWSDGLDTRLSTQKAGFDSVQGCPKKENFIFLDIFFQRACRKLTGLLDQDCTSKYGFEYFKDHVASVTCLRGTLIPNDFELCSTRTFICPRNRVAQGTTVVIMNILQGHY